MTHEEAVAFLEPAGPFHGVWADIGAGTGTFTRALAELLGPDGSVIAIDRDDRALAELRRRTSAAGAQVAAIRGDMRDLSSIDGGLHELDGVLFANALHFTRKPDTALADAAARLRAGGRVVVIEYDRRMPNPWVPHPLPLERLAIMAERAGLSSPQEVARRASAYHREMYCAVLTAGAR